MRDPAKIFTRRGTPLLLLFSRGVFLAGFLVIFSIVQFEWMPRGALNGIWLMYLLIIYVAAERIYAIFFAKGIDLTFAFPLLFLVYVLHVFSLLVEGQEHFPLLNRAEHLTTYILAAYIIWVFFLQYLPQKVWQNHPYYTALLVLSITSFAGVLNEIVELAFDTTFGMRTVGSGYDTSLDLLMNTLGAGLFLAVQLILKEGNITLIDNDQKE